MGEAVKDRLEISTASAPLGGLGQTVRPPLMSVSVIHALTGPLVNLDQDLTGLSYILFSLKL